MDIEQLRTSCLSFPGTSEGIKYGDQLCFMVLGKVFCSSNLKHLDRANFKVDEEEFEALCDRPGIVAAPYGGSKFKWVQVTDFDCLTDREWAEHLRKAYDLVKAKLTKKEQAMLNEQIT
ncbi:MAG: MmcQ/YjbR family DNA-binding protein [Saprospiraceae bacterium]|nr:MmcQ/YjbR family DNA-binding protein [Saprospiraceae bacterium]